MRSRERLPLRQPLEKMTRPYCCRTTSSPSFSPESTDIFAPLDADVDGNLLHAILAFQSGMSTDAYLSLSYMIAPSDVISTFLCSSRMITHCGRLSFQYRRPDC